MELKEIRKLLDKYYEGLTSLEDERLLKDFFASGDVPDDLRADKELFLYAKTRSEEIPVPENLNDRISSTLGHEMQKERKTNHIRLFYQMTSVAAGLAILVVLGLMLMTSRSHSTGKDTYTDPKMAYEQVKRTLLYISENLNRGTRPLQQVNKINQGFDELSAFSSFSSGIKDLELVSKYYDTNKMKTKKK